MIFVSLLFFFDHKARVGRARDTQQEICSKQQRCVGGGRDEESMRPLAHLSLKVYCVRKRYLRYSARSVNSVPSGARRKVIPHRVPDFPLVLWAVDS